MTTLIPFTPSSTTPFTFTASIGGTTLYGTVPFNLYADRYYVQLSDGNNNIVSYVPMIASPDNFDINLALPYATAGGSLIYRASTNNFEAT